MVSNRLSCLPVVKNEQEQTLNVQACVDNIYELYTKDDDTCNWPILGATRKCGERSVIRSRAKL